jgi:hypothetical protein
MHIASTLFVSYISLAQCRYKQTHLQLLITFSWKTLKLKYTKIAQARVARWFIFRPSIVIWVNFGGSCNGRCGVFYGHFVYFAAIWYIFRPCGIFHGNLVYFSPFGYIVPRKIWQPWSRPGLRVYIISDCLCRFLRLQIHFFVQWFRYSFFLHCFNCFFCEKPYQINFIKGLRVIGSNHRYRHLAGIL